MEKRMKEPVRYLQITDFDKDGNLINQKIKREIPTLVMIQSTHCGHCIEAKPAFFEFAVKNKDKCFCASILVDGEIKGEKEIRNIIKKIDPSFSGFPHYVLYYKNKRYTHDGVRSVFGLSSFVSQFV